MIIIPEIETVVILVPRTGSGSLKRSITATYPKSMLLYRHMEADGIPLGYDRWRRVGVVRNPLDRLWSLYKFQRGFSGQHDQAYIDAMRSSVDRPFDDWILNNRTVFTSPYDSTARNRFWPHFSVRHPVPENRKSQWLYLRPDLGTDVYRFDRLDEFTSALGVEIGRTNVTAGEPAPAISNDAATYMAEMFAWDYQAAGVSIAKAAAA